MRRTLARIIGEGMTALEVVLIVGGLFAFIAAVAYAAEGGPAWIVAALVIGGLAAWIPWRTR